MFTLGAFAIILNERGHVLLCHRRDMDAWDLPGGGVESGELPTEAAIRETLEETGLRVEISRLVGIYGKKGSDELVFAFACTVIGGQLATSDETDECRYFPLDALPANTLPKHVERIEDAAAHLDQPVIRRQGGPSSRRWIKELER